MLQEGVPSHSKKGTSKTEIYRHMKTIIVTKRKHHLQKHIFKKPPEKFM